MSESPKSVSFLVKSYEYYNQDQDQNQTSPPQLQSTPAVKRTRQESESSAASAGNARKRGRPTKVEAEAVLEAKRVKLSSRLQTRGCGHVLTLGQGDTGQLGLGEDIMERARPALVKVSREMETVISRAANEPSASF